MKLQGVGAIVTGGASVRGAATGMELAKAGPKVAIFDMNLDLAEQTAKEIGGVAIKCDVADGPGGEAAVKEAIAKVGPVCVLVNCAGVGTQIDRKRDVSGKSVEVSVGLGGGRIIIKKNRKYKLRSTYTDEVKRCKHTRN